MSQTWVQLLYDFFQIPSWFFSFVGFSTYAPQRRYFVTDASSTASNVGNSDALINSSEVRSDSLMVKIDSNEEVYVFWWLNFRTAFYQVYNHFPAKLIVGPIQYDVTAVSIVFLSAFVAIISSSFVLLLLYIYNSQPHRVREDRDWYYAQETVFTKRNKKRFLRRTKDSLKVATDTARISKQFLSEHVPEIYDNSLHLMGCETSKSSRLTLHLPSSEINTSLLDQESLASETLLRVTSIPYAVKVERGGDFPAVESNGKIAYGFKSVLMHLKEFFPFAYEAVAVPTDQIIQAHFVSLHLNNDLCRLLSEYQFSQSLAEAETESPADLYATAILLESITKSLDILSAVLGSRKYFFSDTRPTHVDVSVFAELVHFSSSQSTRTFKQNLKVPVNLNRFCIDILEEYWSTCQDRFADLNLRGMDSSDVELANILLPNQPMQDTLKTPDLPSRVPSSDSDGAGDLSPFHVSNNCSEDDQAFICRLRQAGDDVCECSNPPTLLEKDMLIHKIIDSDADTVGDQRTAYSCRKHSVILDDKVVSLLSCAITSGDKQN